jgi:hypothetical protein
MGASLHTTYNFIVENKVALSIGVAAGLTGGLGLAWYLGYLGVGAGASVL